MAEIDERAARKRGTWSARGPWNRIVYALVVGWLFWLAFQRPSEWLILPVAAVAWVAISAGLVMIDRRRWDRENS
jgi:hypothetical protein